MLPKETFARACIFILASSPSLLLAGGTVSIGPGNPASYECLHVGGTESTFSADDGSQFGICNLDGGQISSWSLFEITKLRNENQATLAFFRTLKTENPASGTEIPNPAAVYCVSSGGHLKTLKDSGGNESGFCLFDDASVIEEWTLFLGPKVHKTLARVLKIRP